MNSNLFLIDLNFYRVYMIQSYYKKSEMRKVIVIELSYKGFS